MMRWVLAFLLLLLPGVAAAQVPPDYQKRADQFVKMLTAPGDENDFFSPVFLDAVPPDQWRAQSAQWRQRHGTPQKLGAVTMESPTSGAIEIRYATATLGFQMVIAPQAPHQVIGLRLTGVKQADDSMAKIDADFAALPGHAAFAVARLGGGPPAIVHSGDPDRQMATGSSFKLYILAELARAVAAGEHQWSDVVPLARKSFSGRLANAPDNAPMTLHSLALAMISESDNSATDTLLLALGRDKVDAMVRMTGHHDPARTLPLLTTSEAFALKMPAAAALRTRYATASPDDRARLLRDNAAQLGPRTIDVGAVATTPVAIDQIEWFASPMDMVRVLDWLRRQGGEALPILKVNPGIAMADAARWDYLGYKGGSEPGVIAMNFLARGRNGHYYAIATSWNDATARLDEGRFIALVTRLMNLLAEQP